MAASVPPTSFAGAPPLPGTAKIVRFHELGGAGVLKLEELPIPQPGPGEVRLRVRAIGLNRAECVFRKGQYLVQPILPSKLGYEASGVVEAIGPGVSPDLIGKIRSTVPAFDMREFGVYGEVALVPASALAAYPESLNFEQGTSIWMQYFTAWGALCHLGRLAAGDFVVITAASSSVGLAAIEMTRAEGGTAIAVTRTAGKRQALLELGAHHVIVTEEEDLVERIGAITGGKGARLTFDPVGGPLLAQLTAAAADFGLLIEYGALSRDATPLPLFDVLSKHLTIRGYTLFELMASEARGEGERYIYDRLQSGAFRPVIAKTFPLAEIADAQRYMESNEQIGKIVVTV